MPDAQDDWIEKRVDTAREACPVPDAVALAIKAQLQGTMRERSLRRSELTALAKTLLETVNNPPDAEVAK